MKRILHVTDSTGPGGAETIFIELVNRAQDLGFHSTAVVPEPALSPGWSELGRMWVRDTLAASGIDPVVLPTKGSLDLRHVGRLVRLIRRERIDLIQSHQVTAAVYCATAGRITGVPIVSTFHGVVDLARQDSRRRLKYAIINAGGARTVFVSQSLRQLFLAETKLRADRSRVIHNGIDTDHFSSPEKAPHGNSPGGAARPFVVGAVGNIRPEKGYPLLLEAAAWIRRRAGSCKIVIVGQEHSPHYEELLLQREKLGLEDMVEFCGHKSDIVGVLRGLDVLLLTSRYESFSLTVVEALACGVPVVSTRCGGPEEIITDGETGRLVDHDPEAIAAAVAQLLGDESTRAKMGERGKQVARERFSLAAMAEEYGQLYRELLSTG